jgi:uncharacterized protein YegL
MPEARLSAFPIRIAVLVLLAAAAAAGPDEEFESFRGTFKIAFSVAGNPPPSAADRLAAVESMGTFKHEGSTRLLVSVIPDERARVAEILARREAILAGRDKESKGRNPEPYLKEAKRELDEEYRVLEAIETACAGLEDRDAIAYLGQEALLRHKEGCVREFAARVLGKIADRTQVTGLTKALKDKEPPVRAAALLALGAMRGEESFAEILAMLPDKDWTVRSAAIDTLGKLLDYRAVDALLARMKVEEERLAEDCAEALEKVTGQKFGRSLDAWGRWWADHRERALRGERLDIPKEEPKPEETMGDRYYHGIPVRSARTVFILDISESMSYSTMEFQEKPKPGEPSRLDLAKRELLKAVADYDPKGTFGIVAFHSVIVLWRPRLAPATPQMKGDAKSFIEPLVPTGTTNIYGALETAFRMAGMGLSDKYYEPAVDTVFLLSDGAPTNEDLTDDSPDRILRAVRDWNRLGRVKIHTIGLKGHSAEFMSTLARENNGIYASRDE